MFRQSSGVAFLLAQIGAAAAADFAEKIKPLGLTPPQAGLLRLIASSADASQQELAARLGTAPSRVVGYLDDLEHRGIVSRQPGLDRRVNRVSLTTAGRTLLAELTTAARGHEADITAALTATQRNDLRVHLAAIADSLDLSVGVHPGYANRKPSSGPMSARSRRTPDARQSGQPE